MFAVALLIGFWTQLQAAVVTGRVTDSATGRGLEGASVLVSHSAGAIADGEGYYILSDLTPENPALTVSCIGYQTERRKLTGGGDTLYADFNLAPLSIRLDEVVTTATRTLKTLKNVPVATELVTRSDFQRRGAATVAEALDAEIGYEVQEDFSGQGVMLQGVDPDKVLILVDGSRVIGRVNGSIDLEQLSVNNVKQIEVVKGAVSTLYGSEAIGGVINIISEAPSPGLRIRADAFSGGYFPNTDGYQSGSLAYSPGVSFSKSLDRWSFTAGGRFSRNGLIDITPETEHTTGVPATTRFNGDLKAVYRWKPTLTLTATTRTMDEVKEWVEDSGLMSVRLAFDDYEVNRSLDWSLEALYAPSPEVRESFKLYNTSNYHKWEKRTQPKWGPVRVEDYSKGSESYTEFSTLMTRKPSESHLLTLGGDIYSWDISSNSEMGNNVFSPFSGTLTAWSGFMQDEWKIGGQWTLLPGVRYENHEIYGGNLAPRLSTMFTPRDDIRVRASVGSGYRAPSAKELYYVFNHSSAGYIVRGNPDLQPEQSVNFSVSVEHHYSNATVARATLFQNSLRNLIDFYQTGVTEQYYLGEFQYKNVYSAWVRGVEIENSFRPVEGLELKLAYMFMESHNGLTGNRLLRRPTSSGRWDVTYSRSVWTGKLWGRFTSRMMFTDIFETDEQSSAEWTNAYELWNVSIAREWGKDWSVFMKVENLLDHTHGRYGPYEGRTVSLGSSWSFNQ